MDASQVLWEKWHEQVKGLFPTLHGHQQKLLAFMVAGMVVSGGAVLQRMAETIQQQGWSQAKMSSIERRLERFLANEQVEVTTIWKAFLGEVLPYWQGKKLTFVLDCTPYNAQFTIVYLGLLVHSRVLPVAWTVMPQQEKWQERQWDMVARLLDSVRVFLPETECTLLADRGLAGAALVRRMSSNVTGITCCASVRSIPAADAWANRTSGASGVASRALSTRKASSGMGVRSSGKRRPSKPL